jgi:penicillin-binding protein 1A
MLREVINSGTATRAKALDRPLAGKTGTTNDFTDAWFVGFSPSLTCGVWVGFDDHHSLGPKEEGARVALPIWMEFMGEALKDQPAEDFPHSPLLTSPDQVKEILASAEADRLLANRSTTLPTGAAATPAEGAKSAAGAASTATGGGPPENENAPASRKSTGSPAKTNPTEKSRQSPPSTAATPPG